MDRHNENQQCSPKPANQREIGSRRVLRDIRNLVRVPPYPCAVTKRSLIENEDDGKNPNFVPRRPVTRQFAANLARRSQPYNQAARVRDEPNGDEMQKQPTLSIKNPHDNVDDCEAVDELPPLITDKPKDMVDCELKEIAMEDFVIDAIHDIDGLDVDNPLAVVDYVEDIYKFYKENELLGCVNPDYMSDQFDINERMRAILIDWLIEVHYKFELMDETLFLMVNIIDRFLERKAVVRKKLQLVGVTAMLLACKYEEVSVPVVEDLILVSDRAYKREEILEMEKLMANTLQFNMSVPTPYVFMIRFLKAAQSDKKLELVSFFIIELCLVEYQMLKFRPSLLAAAAVYTAACTHKGSKHWTRTSELHTSYSEEQLLDCSRMMVEFHQKAGVGKLTSVHRKYSTFKLGCAAKSEPALFLLDI